MGRGVPDLLYTEETGLTATMPIHSFILKSAEAATSEDWDAVFGSNVKGCGLTSKYAIKAMRAGAAGAGAAAGGDASRARPTKAIVNLGSISSFIGQADLCTYSTTKAAILALTRCAWWYS